VKRIGKRFLLCVLVAFLLASAIFFSCSSSLLAQDQIIQVIELTAKKYEYSPSPLHVKAGTKVQLKITAKDHDHGFKIATVPDGSEPNSKPGPALLRCKTVGNSRGRNDDDRILGANDRHLYVQVLP